MKNLMNSLENIIYSNERLQDEIIEKRKYMISIQYDLSNSEKKKIFEKKENRAAQKRLQKYSGNLMKRTRGVALKKIKFEINKLQINLEDIKSSTTTYKEKLNSEEEIVNQITVLNTLKNELVHMNKELKKEAIKYLQEIDFSKLQVPLHIQNQIISLQSKISQIAIIKSHFNDSVDDEQFFNDLNDKLKSAVPIFSNLERIFHDYAMSTFSSGYTISSSVLSALSLCNSQRNFDELSENSSSLSLNSSNIVAHFTARRHLQSLQMVNYPKSKREMNKINLKILQKIKMKRITQKQENTMILTLKKKEAII